MILIQRPRVFLSSLVILVSGLVTQSGAQLILDVAPSGNDVSFALSWDSLAGTIQRSGVFWSSMDATTGLTSNFSAWGTNPNDARWPHVGDYVDVFYDGGHFGGFGHGVDGVVSNPAGWGIVVDDDSGGPLEFIDDIYIFTTTGAVIPPSGAFTLTVPGAHMDKFFPGTYTNNPNAIVSVVPEPSAIAFLSLIGVAVAGWQWKRKWPSR